MTSVYRPVFLLTVVFIIAMTSPVQLLAERLVLPNPDIAAAALGSDRIRLVVPGGENLSFKVRGPQRQPPDKQEDCPASLYLELGSRNYVSRSIEEEQERRRTTGQVPLNPVNLANYAERRNIELNARRAAMGYGDPAAFLSALSTEQKDSNGVPKSVTIKCNLKLDASDEIFTRLSFVGADSSNVTLECGCEEGRNGQCARIVNPFSLEQMDRMQDKGVMGGEPPMLTFSPGRCGLNLIAETGAYTDAIGAIAPSCDPVTGVRINRCELHGRIFAGSFGGDSALYSSPRADHVKRLRESAAQNLSFSRMKIFGQYRTPIHLLPGVHHVIVNGSEIRGGQYYSTVYLPAEGGFNRLVNNDIWGQSVTWDLDPEKPGGSRREVIAIDSSEHNRIINNRFHRMPYGGIFLFRNCGESSMIRNRPAQFNQIINNVFDFGGNSPGHPAVFIGSRDELTRIGGVKRYCDHDLAPDNSAFPGNDAPFPWDLQVFPNSSEDDGDWAGNNVVSQNSFANYGSETLWRADRFIKLSQPARQLANNYTLGNYVDTRLAPALERQSRQLSGCATVYEKDAGTFLFGARPFIAHGEPIDTWWSTERPIRLESGPSRLCIEGLLLEGRSRNFRISEVSGDCSVNGDSPACSRVKPCPAGMKLVGVQAACNLEWGAVTDDQLDGVPINQVEVMRPSDNIADGHCHVNELDIAQGKAVIPEWVNNSVRWGCSERDSRDSGECNARVRMYCSN